MDTFTRINDMVNGHWSNPTDELEPFENTKKNRIVTKF